MRVIRLGGWFILGLVWDAVITLETRLIVMGWVIPVGITTFGLTVGAFTVYDKLVGGGLRWPELLALACGSSVGAMLSTGF